MPCAPEPESPSLLPDQVRRKLLSGFGQSVAAPNVCPAPNCDASPMHWHRDSRRSPPIPHQESRSCYALALNRLNDTKGPNSISRHFKGRIGGQMLQGERVITSVLRVLGELQQLAGFRSLECQYIASHLQRWRLYFFVSIDYDGYDRGRDLSPPAAAMGRAAGGSRLLEGALKDLRSSEVT